MFRRPSGTMKNPSAQNAQQAVSQAATQASKIAQQVAQSVTEAVEAQTQKKKTDEPTVVQHEGWLLKRGAGYHAPPPPSEGGRKSDLGQLSQPPSAASPTSKVAAKKPLLNLMQGSAEKRRYFMLVTTRAEVARNKNIGPMAELRYYEKGRPDSSKVKPKGSIVFTADMSAALEDTTIQLVTSTRVFYLRPDLPVEQASSAKARTSSSQWLNAIQFALNGLRAWELQGAMHGSTPHPMGDRRSLRVLQAAAAAAAGGEVPGAARRSKRNNLNPLAEMGAVPIDFCELWALHGIEAYDRVVNHFGPVQTDLARLKDHFVSRVAQTKAELAAIDDAATHSKEIVVKEQKTIGDVQRELHRTAQRQTLALREYVGNVEAQILSPIDESSQTIAAKLENVVQQHANAATYVDGAKRALVEASEKVDRVLEMQAVNPSASFEQEINDARQARRDASQTLIITETKHAESISKAMTQLEDLEKARLQSLFAILTAAGEVEQRLVSRLAQECTAESIVGMTLDQIDPPKDIRASFQLLKKQAEKSRGTGRHRKKNSLMNRTDFQALSLEEA